MSDMHTEKPAPPASSAHPRFTFEFTGTGNEYFRVWAVNLLLTILTLGLYSAWAKVRRLRYFYGNTLLDDHRFDYLATGKQILRGRLIAVFALLLYGLCQNISPIAGLTALAGGLCLLPLLFVATLSFRMRNTAYRNIRFHFPRLVEKAYRVIAVPIVVMLALAWAINVIVWEVWETGLTSAAQEMEEMSPMADTLILTFIFLLALSYPFLDHLKTHFFLSHVRYGNLPASFSGTVWGFWWLYIEITFLNVMILVLGGTALYFSLESGLGTDENGQWEEVASVAAIGAMLLLAQALVIARFVARRRNMIFSHTRFGESRLVSRLRGPPLAYLYISNTVAIIASLGLLYPWAAIRSARYFASCTELEARDLSEITAPAGGERAALGEEMSEAFDLDFGP